MSNNSTLKDKKIIIKKDLKASAKTMEFLKMFARSYKVEKKLPNPMNEVFLN